MIETKELGAGSYPEPTEKQQTVKVICSFEGYITIPIDWDYEMAKNYADGLSFNELTTETDNIEIKEIEFLEV